MPRGAAALLLGALASSSLGCHARLDDSLSSPRSQRRIEVVTWWDRIGKADPLGALVREHHRGDPGAVVIHSGADLSALTRRNLYNRMLRGDPPDVFEASAGLDLLQWVRFNRRDARESKLLPLDDLMAGTPDWRSKLLPAVRDLVTLDGKLYGVPSNVHRTNELFFNRKVLRQYGLEEPRSLEDLSKIGERLRGTGVPLLALGGRDPWSLAPLVFECLLVAREGAGTYLDYFAGKLKADDPRVVRTLEASLGLLSFVGERDAELTWLQAVEQVVEGRAAMTIMGDWARLAFTAHGSKPGVDFDEVAFPGTEGIFVFASDVFALPSAAENPAGARRLLATIASLDGQRALSELSGVLPARLDVPPSGSAPDLDPKYDLLRTGQLVPALSGLVPAGFAADLASALVEMAKQRDVEPAVQTLRSRYALLR
jgi:glucose/mannose transport system substrate-binding protein